MAGRGGRPSRSIGASPPSVVTPRTVGVIVGGACLVALALAVVEAGGSIPVDESVTPNPLGLRLMALGLVALGAGLALRLKSPSLSAPDRREPLTLDEADIGALLARWYPDWEPRYRRRVATAIAYHRRRREAG